MADSFRNFRGFFLCLLFFSTTGAYLIARQEIKFPESIREQVTRADSLLHNSRYPEARKLYTLILDQLGDDDPTTQISLLNRLGNTIMNMNLPAEAEVPLQNGLTLGKANFGDDSRQVGESYYYLGKNLSNQTRRFEEAQQHLEKSLEIRRKLHPEAHETVASSLTMLGVVLMNQGKYQNALALHEEAFDLWNQMDASVSPQERSRTYHSIGWIQIALAKPLEGLKMFEKSIEINRKVFHPNHGRISNDLARIAQCYNALGQTENALRIQEETLEIRKKNFGGDHPNVAQSYMSLARLYFEQGETSVAIDYTLQAIRIYELTRDRNDPVFILPFSRLAQYYADIDTQDSRYMALQRALSIVKESGRNAVSFIQLYINLADYAFDNNQYNDFVKYIATAEDLVLKNYGAKHPFYASVMRKKADALVYFNQTDKALISARQALEITKGQPERHPNQVISRLIMSKVFAKKQIYDSALYYCDESLSFFLSDQDDSLSNWTVGKYSATTTPQLIEQTLEFRAKVFGLMAEASNDPEYLKKALGDYKESLSLREGRREKLLNSRVGATLYNFTDMIYDKALEVTYELFKKTGDPYYESEAFDISERSKGIIFLSDLDKRQSLRFSMIPDSLVRREQDIISQIQYLTQRQATAAIRNLKDIVVETKRQIFELREEHNQLIAEIKEISPDFWSFKFQNEMISLNKVKEGLKKEGRALLEYTITDNSIFIHAITADTSVLIRQSKKTDLQSWINAFRKSHTDYSFIVNNQRKADSTFVTNGHQLFTELVSPVANVLTGVKELVIVQDDFLYDLNFGLLLKNKHHLGFSYPELSYLMKDFAVSYGSSITIQKKLESLEVQTNRKSFGGFATDLLETSGEAKSESISGLAIRAPGSQVKATIEEVENIATLMDGETFINEASTEEQFKKQSNNYRVIHLAMHGNIDNDNPYNSSLIFAKDAESTDDGFLTMQEIYGLRLNAELIVLSACNSGYSDFTISGEGLASMSRGFMFSGIPSLIMSQWSIPDEATSEIMLSFYQNLAAGDRKSVALQQAKMNYLATVKDDFYAHPFFWAGMSHMGNTQSLHFQKSNRLVFILSFSILLLVLIVFLSKRKLRHQIQ